MNFFRICVTLFITLSLTTYEAFASNSQKTLKRKIDHVVIKGKDCLGITGGPISNYGLYAFKKGKLNPVPFQIDEIDEDGKYVLTHGKEKTQDSDKGLFDDNDELVFMAKDTGDKIKSDKIIPGDAKGCIEIEIKDPVNSRKSWTYLVSSGKRQPRSKKDYVNYNARKLLLTAQNYIVEFNENFPAGACRYAFWKGLGGDGTDLIDRVKVRVKMKMMFTFDRSEEDVEVTEFGYIDGPVRVVVHTKNTTPLFLGIPASTTYQDTFYYYTHADFPFVVSFPVKPNGFSVKIIDDLINCEGWKLYTSTNPKGHVIDGKMDDSDKKLDLSPWKWSVITNGKFGFWARWFAPSDSPVRINLYYNDDKNAKDDQEDLAGEFPGIGYNFPDGWLDLKTDKIEFRLVHFFTKGYRRGMEKEVTSVHDRPLKMSAKKIK